MCVLREVLRVAHAVWVTGLVLAFYSCTPVANISSRLDEMSGKFTTPHSITLHHTSHGQGRPILFIHGFGASSYSWQRIVPKLSQTNRLILIDLKGHGASPKPLDTAYSLKDQADLVTEFIQEHDLHNLTLVGHSLGGGVALIVALRLAEQSPGRISSLVLIDTVAYSQSLPRFIRLLRLPILGSLATAVTPTTFQVRLMLELAYFDDTKITDELVEAYSAPLRLPGGRHALIESAKQIVPRDIEEISSLYSTITIPTLIIWGSHDEVVPVDIGKRLHQAVPNSRLAIIEQSGHIPQEESPDKALSEISPFLKNTAKTVSSH